MDYDHFTYGEALASSLKEISHTAEKKRFFTAFGLEDLLNFNDNLSSVTGTILIAVDSQESESKDNGADGLNDKQVYSFIVAKNTISGKPSTINHATKQCKLICKQIRNKLLSDPTLDGYIDRNTEINGIGPIGDNFYGTALTFFLNVPENFIVDENFFQ